MNDERLINAISNLSDAFHNVLDVIETDSKYDTFICDDYPFDLSFDEMFVKVFNWKETMKRRVYETESRNKLC